MTTDQTPSRDRLFALIASIPGSGTVDWCGAARALLDEIAAASPVPPPADQPAPRDRIAAAIWERQNPGRRWADCEYRWRADAEADADAVLAVLPEQTDRAAVLLEAANFLRDAHFRDGMSVQEIGTAMRHWADRARPAVGEQPETQEAHPPYSEYRVENYDAGAWQVIGLKRKTLDDAQEVRDRFRRGYPDARLRIIRRDESVAVVETDPEPRP